MKRLIFWRFFKFLQLSNSNRSKKDPKNFLENISKMTGATVVQNFGILDGTADLRVEIWPKFFCQFSAVMWWTFAENFNEISQTVFEQSSIYWKILDSIRLSSVDLPTFSKNWLNLGVVHKLRYAFEVGGWSAKYNYRKLLMVDDQ